MMSQNKRIAFIVFIAVLTIASFAIAHGISLWAEVQNGKVVVDAFFSSGKKVTQGQIVVYDAAGKKLLEGKTDDNGRFEFDPPIKDEMTIKLNPGTDHFAMFKLKKEEFEEKNEEPQKETPAKE